jgi:hypothetical protein
MRSSLGWVVVIILFHDASLSTAGQIKWIGFPSNNSESWGTASNWQGGALPGSAADVLINPGAVILDPSGLTQIGSLSLGAGSTLTIDKGHALGVGGSPTGSGLLVNSGTINVSGGGLNNDLTQKGLLNLGSITVDSGGNLTFSNSGSGTGRAFTQGTISVGGSSSAAAIQFTNSGSSPTANFQLAGAGTVLLSDNAGNSISGTTGTEVFTNSATTKGSGSIQNFASITNSGTLSASGAHALTVDAPLTNWSTGVLTGGSYEALGTLVLKSLGSAAVTSLASGAAVTLGGSGLFSGDGVSNSLSALASIGSSALNLVNGANLTLTPGTGNLTLNAPDNGFRDSILSVSGSQLTVSGNLVLNSGSAQTSRVSVSAGGSLTAAGLSNNGLVSVDPTGTADFRGGAFQNLSPAGDLSGGYTIGGTFYYTGGAIANIAAGSALELDGTGSLRYGGGNGTDGIASLAANHGTLTLNNGGSLTLSNAFSQNGSLNVTGNSSFSSAGLTNSGTLFIESGSSADVSGGKFTNVSGGALTGGTYRIGGSFLYGGGGIAAIAANTTVELEGSGQFLASGATNGLISLTANGGTLALNQGATLTTSGSLTQTGASLSVTASSLTLGGALSQDAASVTALLSGASLAAAGLNNQGLLNVDLTSSADFRGGAFSNLSNNTLSGGSYKIAGSLIYDAAGSAGDIVTIGSGTHLELDGAGQILYGPNTTNALLNLSANHGVLTLDQDIAFTPASLTLNGGFSQTGGSLNVLNGSVLSVSGALTQDANSSILLTDFAVLTAAGLTSQGKISVDSTSAADFASGTNGTFTNLSTDGTLSGGTYKIAGAFFYDPYADPTASNAGGDILKIAPGTTVEIDGLGTLYYTASDGSGPFNGLANLATNSGTLILSNDENGFGGVLSLNGDLSQENGTLLLSDGSFLMIGGGLAQDAGSVTSVDASSELSTANGFDNKGALTGTGTIDGDLINEGVDTPGDPGVQTINGDYLQTIAGMLELDFAGDDPAMSLYDNLDVSGDVSLAGELEVNFTNGFLPQAGDQFTILRWTGSRAGNFDTFVYNSLPSGLTLTEEIDANDIRLVASATPEPRPAVLLLPLILLCVGTRARARLPYNCRK